MINKDLFLFKALQTMEWDYPLRGVYLSQSIYSPEFSFVVFISLPCFFAIFSLLCPKKDKLEDRQLRISKCWVIGGFFKLCWLICGSQALRSFLLCFFYICFHQSLSYLIKIYRSSNKPQKSNKLFLILNHVPYSLSPKKHFFFLQQSDLRPHWCTFSKCIKLLIAFYWNLCLNSPATAATQTMKVLARRWHSLCLWGKARTEELLEDKTNTGALEELMKRWGHCQETGEVKGNTEKSNTNGEFVWGIIGRHWILFDRFKLTAWSRRVKRAGFSWDLLQHSWNCFWEEFKILSQITFHCLFYCIFCVRGYWKYICCYASTENKYRMCIRKKVFIFLTTPLHF